MQGGPKKFIDLREIHRNFTAAASPTGRPLREVDEIRGDEPESNDDREHQHACEAAPRGIGRPNLLRKSADPRRAGRTPTFVLALRTGS